MRSLPSGGAIGELLVPANRGQFFLSHLRFFHQGHGNLTNRGCRAERRSAARGERRSPLQGLARGNLSRRSQPRTYKQPPAAFGVRELAPAFGSGSLLPVAPSASWRAGERRQALHRPVQGKPPALQNALRATVPRRDS